MTAKRLAAALAAFLLLAPSAWAADAVIPALTAAGAVAGADLLPTSQSGGAATKQTMTAIAVYTNGVLVGASNTFTGADNFTGGFSIGGVAFGGVTGSFTVGDCVQVASTGPVVLQDSGSTGCGGGGGGAVSITALDGSITVSPPTLTNTGTITIGLAPVAKGGTGLTTGTSGGILGYTATGTLASSAALTNHAIVLGGGAGATPTALGSLGSTTTLLHGNAAGAPTFAAVTLTTDVTGTLPVGNGGTGLTSGTSGGIIGFTGSGTLASSGALTASALLLGGGAGATPTALGSLGTTTTLLHGNAAGAPTFGAVTLTTDVTGTLPVASGGTGDTSLTAHDLLVGNGTGGLLFLAPSTNQNCAISNGTDWTSAACPSATALTVTDGTHSVPTTTTEQFGNCFVVSSPTGGTAVVNSTVSDVTKSGSYQVAAGDMCNAIVLTGAFTLTFPTESATIFAPGMSLSVTNNGAGNWTLTNSTGLTMTGLNSTTLPPGFSGTFVANNDGVHLDFFPGMQAPTSASLGGALSIAAVSHEFLTTLSTAGAFTLAQPVVGDLTAVGPGTVIGNFTGSSAAPTASVAPVLGLNGGTGGSVTLEGATSGSAVIKVAAAAGTGTVFQIPATNGTNGYVLETDGSGVTSWQAVTGTGTVTSISTTSPITGGAITTTGTIACATCVTSASALTANAIVLGGGLQASAALGSLGTATTLLHGNAGGAPTFAAVTLTSDVTGTLPVANGGTGLTAGTSGGILGYTATGTLASSGALTASAIVLGGGAGATPTVLGSLGTTTTLLHGNAAGAPTFAAVSLSADVTGSLALTSLATQAAHTVLVNNTAGSAAPTASAQPILGVNGGTGGTITLNGSTSGSNIISVPAAAGTGTNFVLPPNNGTSGYVLQTDGSGTTTWQAAAATGVTSVTPSRGLTSSATCQSGTNTAITTTGTLCIDAAYIPFAMGGLTLSNDGTSPNTVIDIAAGAATDDTNVSMMKLAAFTKTTGAWTLGSGNGCLDTGSIAASTWYHVFEIQRTDTGVVDALCSTNVSSPTFPTSYTLKRRLGSFKTNGSSNIIAFTQRGNIFWWKAGVLDVNVSTLSTSQVLETLGSVPTGVIVQPICRYTVGGTGNAVILLSPDVTDVAPTATTPFSAAPGFDQLDNSLSAGDQNTACPLLTTNTSAQIGARATAASTTLAIVTTGWVD